MAANEHKYLLDINRHNPLGFEGAPNNSYLGKLNGVSYSDMQGSLSWSYQLETFTLRGNTPTTTVVVAAGIDFIRMPYDFRLTDVRVSFNTASAGATTIDVLESGVSILSTLITVDATEETSVTAAVPLVISDFALANDSKITFDVTAAAGAPATGIKIDLIGYRTT
tara:strand:- start:888 stop:1388 length:501 start_codon:yes stop_codon:yes gene_type:complete